MGYGWSPLPLRHSGHLHGLCPGPTILPKPHPTLVCQGHFSQASDDPAPLSCRSCSRS